MSLPIATLPHVITPSLALSTLADLLPRMNHSNADVRKKTIVTLYRFALVYPEALRAAWPKIKDRLVKTMLVLSQSSIPRAAVHSFSFSRFQAVEYDNRFFVNPGSATGAWIGSYNGYVSACFRLAPQHP